MTIERFQSETLARMRSLLMRKGREIATVLAEVLAGGDAGEARRLVGPPKPGETPAEALRRYLDLIEGRRQLIDDDDDRFGRCDACGVDLGQLQLLEMPWADRCPRHSM